MMIDKKLSIRLDVRLYCVGFGHGDYEVLMEILWERLKRFAAMTCCARYVANEEPSEATHPSETSPDNQKAQALRYHEKTQPCPVVTLSCAASQAAFPDPASASLALLCFLISSTRTSNLARSSSNCFSSYFVARFPMVWAI